MLTNRGFYFISIVLLVTEQIRFLVRRRQQVEANLGKFRPGGLIMKRQRDSDNRDESSCSQPLCFSPPLCLQHCNTNSRRKKKKKDKKEKKLLNPPIFACADPTACCKIPSLSKETACSSIHYLETQREQASKDAFSVLMC